jgi:AraC-like DNA-binding protein
MVILGTVNYYQTLKIMEDKIEKDSMAALKQSSYTVDTFVEKLYQLSSELSLNQRVYDFLYTNAKTARDLNLLAREVMLDLREYTILNDFIGDIYVYSRRNNAIVSPTGLYTPDIFFSSIYPNASEDAEFDKWFDSIKQPGFRKFAPITVNSRHNGTAEKILFKDSLPNIRDNLGCIMVFMNKDRYMDTFSDVLKGYHGNCYILDEELQIIVSDDSQKYTDFVTKNLQSKAAVETISTPDGKVLKAHTSSVNNKWKYVSILPYSAFTREINSLKVSTISIIAVFAVLAFLISFIAANKNYEPIKDMIRFIKMAYGYEEEEHDDYKVISNILESSYKEIKLNREILKSYIPIIKQSYLVKLLRESGNLEKSQGDSFHTLLNIHLNFSASAVALFHIKIKKTGDRGEEHTELYKIALRTAMEESAEYNHMIYAVELDHDNIACIYGSDETNRDNLQDNIYVLARKLKGDLENKPDIVLYVGMGNIYEGCRELSHSYEEADEALNYAMLMNEDIVYYKDILKNSNLFAFPIQKELQLVNAMKAGKQEEALGIINAVYNENCLHKELTYEMMKFFIYDLYCSVIKAVGELNLEHSDPIIQSIRELDDQNNGRKDMSFFLLDIKRKVIYVCKEINDKRRNRSIELETRITNYMEKNFLDSQLSLERIADEFHITPQYLSRFFREHFNMSYVDYVNDKRVSKAKEYLLSDEKVKDAAIKSGFNNIGTFINAFKKYTGFTPGEYKEANR